MFLQRQSVSKRQFTVSNGDDDELMKSESAPDFSEIFQQKSSPKKSNSKNHAKTTSQFLASLKNTDFQQSDDENDSSFLRTQFQSNEDGTKKFTQIEEIDIEN